MLHGTLIALGGLRSKRVAAQPFTRDELTSRLARLEEAIRIVGASDPARAKDSPQRIDTGAGVLNSCASMSSLTHRLRHHHHHHVAHVSAELRT